MKTLVINKDTLKKDTLMFRLWGAGLDCYAWEIQDAMEIWKEYYKQILWKNGDAHAEVNKVITEELKNIFDTDYKDLRKTKTPYQIVAAYQSMFINRLVTESRAFRLEQIGE